MHTASRFYFESILRERERDRETETDRDRNRQTETERASYWFLSPFYVFCSSQVSTKIARMAVPNVS